MFSSSVILTIGRPTLSRVVCSVLDQNFYLGEFEFIVVNDTGQSLPELDWSHSERARIINTQRRERSVARNIGPAIAKGEFLHFLDDDDWLMPGTLEAFWKLTKASQAILLYSTPINQNRNIGTGDGFADLAATIAEILGVWWKGSGCSFARKVIRNL